MVKALPIAALMIGFILTYFSIPSIVAISNAKKLFDIPNKRKLNKVAIPTIGGIAIFTGWSVSSLLFLQGNFVPGMQYLLVGVLLMLFIGVKDDVLIMSARKKLAVQSIVALILVTGGNFEITRAYGMFTATVFNPWFGIPLSILVILFLINAINLIDGIDGLASGLSLFISLFLGTWFFLSGDIGYSIICYALAGSLAAFMRFNLWSRKNKIFMGDTGSLLLGVFLAAIVIRFSEGNEEAWSAVRFSHPPLIALALFIVPVTDTLRVFFIRIREKRSPFTPDMNHIHHLLIKGGMKHIQASAFLMVYTLFFLGVALTFSYFKLEITASFSLLLVLSFAAVEGIREIVRVRERRKTLIQLRKLRAGTVHLNTAGSNIFPMGPTEEQVIIRQNEPAIFHSPNPVLRVKK